jgi:hypothetical protein
LGCVVRELKEAGPYWGRPKWPRTRGKIRERSICANSLIKNPTKRNCISRNGTPTTGIRGASLLCCRTLTLINVAPRRPKQRGAMGGMRSELNMAIIMPI